jgi:hypothetical protein
MTERTFCDLPFIRPCSTSYGKSRDFIPGGIEVEVAALDAGILGPELNSCLPLTSLVTLKMFINSLNLSVLTYKNIWVTIYLPPNVLIIK